MKKALIINEGFSNNLGDQAIRESMTSLLRDSDFSTEFAYFTNPRLARLPEYDYLAAAATGNVIAPMSFSSRVRLKLAFYYWIGINYNAIRKKLSEGEYDVIVIGGGQLIESSGKDYPSRFSIALYWWTYLIKKFSQAKIYIIGVGVGTTFNAKEKSLFAKALSRVDLMWVRDQFSKIRLQEQFGHKAIVTPDIAFYSGKNRMEEANPNRKALIGITNYKEVFSKYNKLAKSSEAYYEEWYAEINNYLREGLTVELFYTTITDAAETIAFRDYIRSKYNVEIPVAKLASIEDLKQLYKSASDVYSGRMHALILAMKHQCKVKAYLISQKLKSFNEEYISSGTQTIEYSKKIRGTFNDLMIDNIKL
ncbi:polysaccharide pyruvyl transferase WcaK-like protein [Chitinophaga polysaccharea]|uniref:Polysaccharide pyruvyl transferase WcaK-like protein n=1 Tax=Chitinophaga polysaccharea TaxID=1293035 RepID=A0A561PNL0_9BACT|nr:polysaccharide pyruvyl transferase family protein [Chitinophaga polysaccharea]TWF39697.1 polysaccharide pyruvyl transferase WcaK-like protein [Chitinophaga polysaccharea]